jgi:DNA-binding NtrC family response regulator
MRAGLEDSPRENGASIDALRWLLATAAGAVGAERAFLVRRPREGGAPGPEVLAAFAVRGSAPPPPSRTLLWRAIGSSGALAIDDAPGDPRLAEAPSVRALEIRAAVAVPIPRRYGEGVVVLDSTRPLPASRDDRALVEACAALAGFVLRSGDAGPAPDRASGEPPAAAFEAHSPASRRALETARRLAATDLPVLILGESGTGKELLAREIHACGRRSGGPFVAVNCAALPEALVEAELFGVVRGAFTGADRDRPGLVRAARRGTLFLDEAGDLPPAAQAKLLRVLQDASVRPVGGTEEVRVDVRVVAATHRDLRRLAGEGRFREDLLHRLAFGVLRVPPLRRRLEEIESLAPALVSRLASRYRLTPRALAPCALRRLLGHDWPGNVRELETVLARALIAGSREPITSDELAIDGADVAGDADEDGLETAMISRALAESQGSVARAARRIGWTRQKLYRAIERLGLDRGTDRVSPIPGGARGAGRR